MKLNYDYKQIFKSTFLFGFVQVFNILIKIIVNKAIAIFLGAEGLGIIGLYNLSVNLLKTAGGLGLSQSAVRDISEASATENTLRFSRVISVTNNALLYTALLGVLLTIIISPWLSQWLFGSSDYISAFIVLSLVVGIQILSEGQLAILKGMRQLKALAKASMIGSFAGLLTAVPFYYYLGSKGILPSMIIAALTALVSSSFYVRKIQYDRLRLAYKETTREAFPMIKMGVAMMYVVFLGFLSDLLISSFISRTDGLAMVGLYQAGATIITSYFGIVITAMSTDYYPRISALHKDDSRLQEEVNKQSQVGLVLALPLVVLFLFFAPFFIELLYSVEFTETLIYTDFAIFGAVIIVCSNNMGMILLAKQKSRVFFFTTTFQRLLTVLISLLAFNFFGLLGLGLGYALMGLTHLLLMSFIMNRMYRIRFQRQMYFHLIAVLLLAFLALVIRDVEFLYIRIALGILLFLGSVGLSLYIVKRKMRAQEWK